MAQIPPTEPGTPTIPKDIKAIKKDIEALWRRVNKSGKKSGALSVYVQPDEPSEADVGALWYDTDAGV